MLQLYGRYMCDISQWKLCYDTHISDMLLSVSEVSGAELIFLAKKKKIINKWIHFLEIL